MATSLTITSTVTGTIGADSVSLTIDTPVAGFINALVAEMWKVNIEQVNSLDVPNNLPVGLNDISVVPSVNVVKIAGNNIVTPALPVNIEEFNTSDLSALPVDIKKVNGMSISSVPVTEQSPIDTVSVDNFPTSQDVDIKKVNGVAISSVPVTEQSPIDTVSVDNFPTSQDVDIKKVNGVAISSVPVTEQNPVDTVSVDNFPSSQDVDIKKVNGLSISSVPVTEQNPVDTVSVDNFPAVQKVDVSKVADVALPDSKLPVNLVSTDFPMPVNLTKVFGTDISSNLVPVDIKNVNGSAITSLPVTEQNPVDTVSVDNLPATQKVDITKVADVALPDSKLPVNLVSTDFPMPVNLTKVFGTDINSHLVPVDLKEPSTVDVNKVGDETNLNQSFNQEYQNK